MQPSMKRTQTERIAHPSLYIVVGLIATSFAVFCPFAARLGPAVIWPSAIVGLVLLFLGLRAVVRGD